MPADGTVFFPVWVSSHGRTSIRWGGPPCDTPSEAMRVGKAEVQAGAAVRCHVVQLSGGVKTLLPTYTFPERDRKTVVTWELLRESLTGGPA